MALTIDRIEPLRLMKSPLYYPQNMTMDKFHGAAVFLLTKNLSSSCKFLNYNRIFVNNGRFVSFYVEKSFDYIIGNLLNESVEDYDKKEQDKIEAGIASTHGELDPLFNNSYIMTENAKLYLPGVVDKAIFSEDFGIVQNYGNLYRKFLYGERIKNQKEISEIYRNIKSRVPFIKNTYLTIDLYRKKNLFMDWSYYYAAFLKNNFYKLDKGLDLLHHMIRKFVNDERLTNNGYTKKLVVVPVQQWATNTKEMTDYANHINPLTMIYRLVKTRNNLGYYFDDLEFLFCNDNAYFKVNFKDFDLTDLNRFETLCKKLILNDIGNAEQAAEVKGAVGNNDADSLRSEEPDTFVKPAAKKEEEPKSDKEWADSVIKDIPDQQAPKVTASRAKRMQELNDRFDNSQVGDEKVKDIEDSYSTKEELLQKEPIPIDSINEEWKNVKFTSFNSMYNATDDIVMILKQLTTKTNPISIVSVTKEDTSTFEDYIDTYTIKVEDVYGTRSELKIDMPKLINHRFMKLRGNIKTLNAQLILIPIIKTGKDTAQIVTNYNKIFIRRVSPANGTKITKGVNKLYKALKRCTPETGVEVFEGDNSKISDKYVVPAEYYELSKMIAKIVLKDGSHITFDLDKASELAAREKYDKETMIPVGYDAKSKKCIYAHKNHIGYDIGEYLASKSKEFAEIYAGVKPSDKLAYTEASILTTRIPVIVIMAYNEGLQTAMDKAKIKYRFTEKRETLKDTEAMIRFNDGYLIYDITDPAASLLMSGLDQCDTEEYSIKDINTKNMWLDMLDMFGGRFKADGLDNFYDCMFDPMSIDICKRYHLPYDYVTALGYASALLADTKYNRHTDITGNRLRTNELLSGYLYKSLSKAYGDYANKVKRAGKGTKITIKQSAVIDNILLDPGCSDLSVLNPLLEAEAANSVSFKGLSGMNSDRSYDLDKRLYDKSMLGILGMSTGFSGNVGITRQLTIDSSIKDERGIVDPKTEQELNTLNGLTIYEAMTPFGTTHDDPARVAMGYIQTVKHQMRVKDSNPNLITYGMDEALPYFTSNIFSYKFKGVKGKVLDVTEDYIIYEEIDKDGKKSNHMVSLKETTMKNSDGGFFITVKLDPMVKKGDILKNNDILAYDSSAYSRANASNKGQKNIAYNIGTMAKVAIMCTDEAYEDSSIIDTRLSEALTSEYCVKKDRSLPANTNVYSIMKVGTPISEGDTLMVFENAFSEKDANKLLQNIADDELELISDFGRIQLRSKISGVLQDIKIYRTCELDDMSSSLKKIVSEYENGIKKEIRMAKKYGVSDSEIMQYTEPTYKLPQNGKLKATENGVLIEFYIKTEDKMGVGDKLTYNTAIKGVIKDIMPEGDEPYTDFRRDEKVDALLTSASVNARMVASIINSGSINKALIELTRKCKDILGIDWSYLGKDNISSKESK